MIVRVGRTERTGRAIDLREHGVAGGAVRAAVARRGQVPPGRERDPIDVACAVPGPAFEYIGLVTSGTAFRRSGALAAAARSRGLTAPADERVADARERLDAFDASANATAARSGRGRVIDARRALETTEREVERCRERAGARRDAVGACEADDTHAALASFREAAGSLADAETRRIAAEQRLDRRERELRAVRDRRERRLQLEDRLENAARDARTHLATALEDRFADALDAVPGREEDADAKTVAPTTAALATARIATVRAPIVLDCDRFPSTRAAAEWLDAPVILV